MYACIISSISHFEKDALYTKLGMVSVEEDPTIIESLDE